MLDNGTKRRIDTARDILVGKIPDPKSQVEQITIALIYKFMDDMDAESEELGGSRNFFAGEFARYGWAKLMRSGLGGHETLNLYAEAIARMPENPGIPLLFRNIFKNAYLPYRDPETLRAFLKVIDEFSYDHSERLGDAFEYLLSVLGSQGDAGQFRTPRHIIDFIVAIVDPKKHETILDPACGTAGFLISSYKHILKNNLDENGYSTLTPDNKGRMVENFSGYDISPDMVRLSLVNMYLHGFSDPQIFEYDTLTSQERWNEYTDVILANPPFMSPKGGIRPHNRFSVQSKRSEVLFVDYIADHLTPEGRAGVIVPEGIIFQSQNAYKQLRKKLLEESLVAVVSLPAGVFQPYSGVKTSILVLDKALAKKIDIIAFFKVENDGFGLGAQRRPIDKNDLPQVLEEVKGYIDYLRTGDGSEEYLTQKGLVVKREKIAENGEYNLSGERYRESVIVSSHYPHAKLKDLLEVQSGFAFKSKLFNSDSGFPIIRIRDIKKNRTETYYTGDYNHEYIVRNGDLLVGMDGEFNSVIWNGGDALLNQRVCRLKCYKGCIKEFIALMIPKALKAIEDATYAVTVKHLSAKQILEIEIPFPPLEIQKEIVAEIESYQKVIDGARAVVENYRPHIPIDPTWPQVKIGDPNLFRIESGGTPKSNVAKYWNGGIAWVTLVDLPPSNFITSIRSTERTITKCGLKESSAKILPENSIVVSTRATIGRIGVNLIPLATNQGFKNIIIIDLQRVVPKYVALAITTLVPLMNTLATGGTFKELSKTNFSELTIPFPPLPIQKDIVEKIEVEQAIVEKNRELIERFENKIEVSINSLWGE
jgi:type I restriction enzyme M protein